MRSGATSSSGRRSSGEPPPASMSRAANLWARISPRLANRAGSALTTRAHAWVYRRSGGRIGRRFLGVEILVLRTTGRKSGKPRESPMFFVREADALAVVASNAGAPTHPAWWLNLREHPDAEVLLDGSWRPVRGRLATSAEAEELWPHLDEIYRGYDHYRSISQRELPLIVLEPRFGDAALAAG